MTENKGIFSKRNIILVGAVLSIMGLIGPWLNFSEYDKGIVYHFNMNPLYMSVKSTSTDPTIPPTSVCITFTGLTPQSWGSLIFWEVSLW